ncbi:MAG: TetR/AcrR family transcriptional regulator [Acidimicrobiales bacterium]
MQSSSATRAPSKGERTRRRILASAIEHFAATGLDGGSVPEIARQAGLSHGAVYQHFGRKEALFRAAVDTDLSAMLAEAHPALDLPAPAPEDLVAAVGVLLAASRTHPLARRVLANIDAEQTEALRDLEALTELEQRLVAAVARGQAAGTLRTDLDAAAIAAGVIGAALPLLVVGIRLDGVADIPRSTDAVGFLVDVLRPPKS